MNSRLQQQLLVRFQDETHVVHFASRDKDHHSGENGEQERQQHQLLSHWSEETGWPMQYLTIQSWSLPFVSISIRSCIRGGKGGFGTLLKGQSRQAGAKLTTDFGACRDLQGRRLRHVNDEIKLRKWREMKRREQAGEKVADDELWKTPTGIYNWHLMTPAWADISKKATYRIKRQFKHMDKEAQKEALKKQEQESVYKNTMVAYLEHATTAVADIQESIPDAIQQGLVAAANAKKRKRSEPTLPSDSVTPDSLCTLSGDIVVESEGASSSESAGVQLQSQSEFGTAVLVLDASLPKDISVMYYEVTVVTGGLAQIGWASLVGESPFAPNDDLGDGVGDDSASYAIDGSRELKFHGGAEESYSLKWKAGDRVGCLLDTHTGIISFSVNGKSHGTAFSIDSSDEIAKAFVPAFSCNRGQILELHQHRQDCKHFPKTPAVAVGDLVQKETSSRQDSTSGETRGSPGQVPEVEEGSNSDAKPSVVPKPSTEVSKDQKPVATEPEELDLTGFHSVHELEALGLDRLKSALMALGVKCGGTLAERAARLFSLKGLPRAEYPMKVRGKGFNPSR